MSHQPWPPQAPASCHGSGMHPISVLFTSLSAFLSFPGSFVFRASNENLNFSNFILCSNRSFLVLPWPSQAKPRELTFPSQKVHLDTSLNKTATFPAINYLTLLTSQRLHSAFVFNSNFFLLGKSIRKKTQHYHRQPGQYWMVAKSAGSEFICV